jgi:hypothetical protein
VIDGSDVRVDTMIGAYEVALEMVSGSLGGFFSNNLDQNALKTHGFLWTGGDFVGGVDSLSTDTAINTLDNTNLIRVAGDAAKGIIGRAVTFYGPATWEGTGTVTMTSAGDRRSRWIFQRGLSVSGQAVIAGLPTQRVEIVHQSTLELQTGASLQVEAALYIPQRPIHLAEDSVLTLRGGGLLESNEISTPTNGLISFEGGSYQIGNLDVWAGNVTDDTFSVQALLQLDNGPVMEDVNNGDFKLRFVSGVMSASGLVTLAASRLTWSSGTFRPVEAFNTNQYPIFLWGKDLLSTSVLNGTNKTVLYSRVSLPAATWTGGDLILEGDAARTASVFFANGLTSDGSMAVQSVISNRALVTFVGGTWQHGGGLMDVQAGLDMVAQSSLLVNSGGVLRLAGGARLLGMDAATIEGTLAVDSLVTYTHISNEPLTVSTNGRLSGTGEFAGTALVEGTLAPGGTAGILTVSNITLGADSVYEWELVNWAQGPGEGFDQLAVSGVAVISNGATIRISVPTYIGDFTGEDRTFEILTSTNAIQLSSVTNVHIQQGRAQSASGGRWELIHTNNSLFLAYSLDPYLQWTASNGLAGAQALFTADPDGDFWNNGIEFVFGTSPTNAASGGGNLNIRLYQTGLGDYALFTYPLRKEAAYLSPRLLLQAELDGMSEAVSDGVNGIALVAVPDVPAAGFFQIEVYVPAILPVRFGQVWVVR